MRYLQIPADLPQELRIIARQLGSGAASKAEILARIESFLAYNYTYSIDVDSLSFSYQDTRAPDFAYAFLFEQSSGYCVHFATSFILLARLSGIPARYATGFFSRIPAEESNATITGLSAHAWPEVWLEDSGWVNWEATPAANASNYTITGDEWFFNFDMDLDQATTRQLEGLIGGSIASGKSDSGSGSGDSFPVGLLFVVIGAAVGGVALAVFAVHYGYPAVRYFANSRGRMYHGLKRLARRLVRKGVPSPTQVGWLAWSDSLKHLIAAESDASAESLSNNGFRKIDDMICVLLALTYGNEKWQPVVADRFMEFRKYVVKGLRRRSKRRGY
jgi:hypothetical protein